MDFKKSQRDWQQTLVYSHNEDTNSLRVEVVGGSDISNSVKEGLKEAFKDVKIDNSKTEVTVVEVPRIITEVQIKEVPVIVKEIEIKEIQIPVIVHEVQIIEKLMPVIQTEFQVIEKPIIIEKIINSDNKALNRLVLIQTICLILLSFLILFKK